MHFLSRVLSVLARSIYDPSFYEELATRRFSSSLAYLIFLTAATSLFYVVWFSVLLYPLVTSFLGEGIVTAKATYPADLVITLNNGNASINQPEPYKIPMPKEWQGSSKEPANLLVVDTTTPFSRVAFEADDTLFLLQRQSLVYERDSNQLEVVDLGRLSTSTVTITKTKVVTFIDVVVSWIDSWKGVIVSVGSVLAFLSVLSFSLIGHLLYLLLGAGLVLVVGFVRDHSLTYTQAYQLGMHLMTLPIIVSIFFTLLNIGRPPFFFTLIFVVFAFLNLRSVPKQ